MKYGWVSGKAVRDLRLEEVAVGIHQAADGLFYHDNEDGDSVCGPFHDEEACHAAFMGYCDWLNQDEEEDGDEDADN